MKPTRAHIGASLCMVLTACLAIPFVTSSTTSAQAPGPWRQLVNGKDLTGWNIAAGRGRAGAAAPAADAPPGWKIEDNAIVGGQAQPGQRTGALSTVEKYKDFELETEFMLAEQGTACSEELIGPKQENGSKDHACLYNSGISFRSGYQLNLGRREAGEYIGVVIHRVHPDAIRGNVLWLGKGDGPHPNLRKKQDWNTLRLSVKGDHIQAWLNGTQIVNVHDNPTLPTEAAWKEAQPITIQWPYVEDFPGYAKFRNIRIRTL